MHLSARERHALADIERQLASDDPELVRRLRLISSLAVPSGHGNVDALRPPPIGAVDPDDAWLPPTDVEDDADERQRRPAYARPLLIVITVILVVVGAISAALLSPRQLSTRTGRSAGTQHRCLGGRCQPNARGANESITIGPRSACLPRC